MPIMTRKRDKEIKKERYIDWNNRQRERDIGWRERERERIKIQRELTDQLRTQNPRNGYCFLPHFQGVDENYWHQIRIIPDLSLS